ncbi:MAG: hypothetical protein R2911_37435 [Caldilineaceae bacterium]
MPGYDPATFGQVQAAGIQEVAIASVQDGLLRQLAGHQLSGVQSFPYVPVLALTLHSAEALDVLRRDLGGAAHSRGYSVAAAVGRHGAVDTKPMPHTAFSTPARGRPWPCWIAAWTNPYAGGQSGLRGLLFHQCSGPGAFHRFVPAASLNSTATNSGAGCSAAVSSCDHGTHVAGIVARRGATG